MHACVHVCVCAAIYMLCKVSLGAMRALQTPRWVRPHLATPQAVCYAMIPSLALCPWRLFRMQCARDISGSAGLPFPRTSVVWVRSECEANPPHGIR